MPATLANTVRSALEPSDNPYLGAADEDDGYLVTLVSDVAADTSECVILDARDIAAGPVCRIVLPERICAGTHATWANGDAIGMGRNPLI